MKFLLPFLFLVSNLLAQSPEELDKIVRRLAPDLVASTIAIMIGGGSGSGVIVSPEGLVVTAAHVTSKPGVKMKVLLADGRELPATSLGVDHGTDGALLQINAPGPFPYRPYVKTKTYKVDDWAIATGHPGGPIIGRPSPLRLGRITQAGTKSGFMDAITTTATVISGDSGGPLYNLKGEVIGINSNISGSWRVNKHVPLPCIVEKWDALLKGESFGKSGDYRESQDNPFDEPYEALRDRFEEALPKYAETHPEAAELLARPRLLDPHHMQALLDRWEPDPDAPTTPQYGLVFDLGASEAELADVLENSPAAKAGLEKGDVIVTAGNVIIDNSVALARILATGGEHLLITRDGRSFTLKPDLVPARKHFPQPVAGMIDMIVTDSPETAPEATEVSQREFLALLDGLRDQFTDSVLPLRNQDGKTLALGTVLHQSGQMITKASEIEGVEGLVAIFRDQEYPVQVRGIDKENDIALLRVLAAGLVPIKWTLEEPAVGELILTPTGTSLISGIITQPARSAPERGYELNYTSEEPSTYLGVSFSAESTRAVIETVESGSPADKVGLLEGDEITSFEGKKVTDVPDLVAGIKKFSAGDKVTLTIKRGDDEIKLEPILDNRPPDAAGVFNRAASMRDGQLSSLSARGGDLSNRKDGFPHVLYHDQMIKPRQTGSPLVNLKGEVVGINVARAMRHRSLAIPTREIDAIVAKLRAQIGD